MLNQAAINLSQLLVVVSKLLRIDYQQLAVDDEWDGMVGSHERNGDELTEVSVAQMAGQEDRVFVDDWNYP